NLAAEDEDNMRQLAVSGDRVGKALERRFQQGRFVADGADRLAPAALFGLELGLGANAAERALVDLEGFRQGDRKGLDVGITGAGAQIEAKRGVLAAGGGLRTQLS